MKAFSRFNSLMAAVALAVAAGTTRHQAINELGGYKSRGKGKGEQGKHYSRTTTRFNVPHGGGKQEVARRQRQIAKGMLRVSA